MTFKKVAPHLYASTHDQKAIDTIRWYEHNQLELEDYETDELFKVLEILDTKKAPSANGANSNS